MWDAHRGDYRWEKSGRVFVKNDARWCPPGLRTEASRTGMSTGKGF